MAEGYEHLRERAESSKAWKSSRRLRIPVDADLDTYSIPLDELNVANPELFKEQLIRSDPMIFSDLEEENK